MVRQSSYTRLQKLFAEHREAKKKLTATIDVDAVIEAARKARSGPKGFGCGRKHIWQEIMVTCPTIGMHALAEMVMLCNLQLLYTLSDIKGVPDEEEAALLAEAAAGLTPCATTLSNTPLYFHAKTVDDMRQRLKDVDTVFGITNWVQRPLPGYTRLPALRALLPTDDDGYLIDGQASDGAQGVDLETDSEGHMGEERGWFESLQTFFASDELDENE
jgi:hypothetical protein